MQPGAPTNRFSVGLTGGIGSGKSMVADMFAARGASVIDTDLIAHQLTAPNGGAMAAIRDAFGDAFVQASGALDRAAMRAQVFARPDLKRKLESILHPLIQAETERAAELALGSYLMFVVPLLVETGTWKHRVSRVLAVDCPETLQVARVMQRNAMTEAQVRAIMATQVSRSERLQQADDVIVNDSDIAALEPQVDRLHRLYSEQAMISAGKSATDL